MVYYKKNLQLFNQLIHLLRNFNLAHSKLYFEQFQDIHPFGFIKGSNFINAQEN